MEAGNITEEFVDPGTVNTQVNSKWLLSTVYKVYVGGQVYSTIYL